MVGSGAGDATYYHQETRSRHATHQASRTRGRRSPRRKTDDVWKQALKEQKAEAASKAEAIRMRSNAERAMLHHRRRKYPECCH